MLRCKGWARLGQVGPLKNWEKPIAAVTPARNTEDFHCAEVVTTPAICL